MKTIKRTFTNKIKTLDPIATIEVATKGGILLVVLILLTIIFYNGIILGGFNSASWGL